MVLIWYSLLPSLDVKEIRVWPFTAEMKIKEAIREKKPYPLRGWCMTEGNATAACTTTAKVHWWG